MILRHASALALVGWYLIAPPLINNDPAQLVADAPISAWQVLSSYDTAASCEKDRASLVSSSPKYQDQLLRKASDTRSQMMICIATNDPRLAK